MLWSLRVAIAVAVTASVMGAGCSPQAPCTTCGQVDGGDVGDPTSTTTEAGDGVANSTGASQGQGSEAPASDGWATGAQADTEDIGETEGLACGGPIPFLVDARIVPSADIVGLFGLDPSGHVVVISSLDGNCDDPVASFDCSDAHEYRFYVEVPTDGLYAGSVLDFEGPDPQVHAWLQASLTPACQATTPELGQGHLAIEQFDPATLEISGRICNHYSPLLGFGLSGTFNATTCGP